MATDFAEPVSDRHPTSGLDRSHRAIDHLRRLSELFHKRRCQLADTVGLTEHQWGVLEEISLEHFMPSMFARQRDSSPAAVSKTLRQLLDKALIAVSVGAADGRQRKYELTAQGHAVMERLRAHRQQAIEQVWERFEDRELEQFCSFAQVLGDRLEALAMRSSAVNEQE